MTYPAPRSVATVALICLAVLGLSGCGDDSSTVAKGTYTIAYTVSGNLDAHITITWTDPGSGSIASTTASTLPWSKQWTVTDPDEIHSRFDVDDSNNDTNVSCQIVVNGQTTTAGTITAGKSGGCASLHF